MKEALVLMAKAPIEGQVKTRLIGALTPADAKQLYVAFLGDIFALMEAVMREKPSGAKGHYIRSLTLATTMSPGIRLDIPATIASATAAAAA